MDLFKIMWGIDDGYVNNGPQSCRFSEEDIEIDMSPTDLEAVYYTAIQEDFEDKVRWYGENLEDFQTWAKEIIAKRGGKDDF